MGWTSYHVDGRINRKEECDRMWTQEEKNGYPKLRVLKSAVKGSIYYAAVEKSRAGNVECVFGVVTITSTNNKDYYNFSYKEMDETSGPYYCDCPKSILDLLTPTESEYANEWRKKCLEKLERNKSGLTLSKLPIGTTIKFKRHDGEEIVLVKMSPNYQFSRAWYYRPANNTYCPSRRIPDNFEIVSNN